MANIVADPDFVVEGLLDRIRAQAVPAPAGEAELERMVANTIIDIKTSMRKGAGGEPPKQG